ncbi:myrosinase 1-like [Aricia agestis]|uniref:myrosinase 1-like n=1 Tax=Aricia agestis TaxID=91739 RepID=UPI001C204B00|nr:myrosinase 1-like [Aricia agestis]
MEKNYNKYLISICILSFVYASAQDLPRKIPKGLIFGAATSSYQVEGAWDADGKTQSILDYLYQNSLEQITDGSNGNVATNSYYLYERDVEMMRELGLDFYRFSLSWPRLLPYNYSERINPAGVNYYNNLMDEMLKYGIEPVVTLYHWDLPLELAQQGGWTNPQIVDWFSDFARTAFELFGDRVKYWITLNEPQVFCYYRHPGDDIYKCMKNSLLAHAKAYHIYDEEFRPTHNGAIFISLSTEFYEPVNSQDAEAAEDATNYHWGVFTNPIFSKDGDFPASMKEKLAAKSAKQGLSSSKLPDMSPEEIDFIKGTSDFFGINHYTTKYVYRNESENDYEVPSFYDDLGVQMYQPDSCQIGYSYLVCSVPWGFYKLLTKIREEFDNPPIFITENGFSTHGGLDDQDRIEYYKTYLCAMLDAIDEGSDVRAYTAWSLMDNFEWARGYIDRFGLYEVDYESEELTRTPRASAFMYQNVLRTRSIICGT